MMNTEICQITDRSLAEAKSILLSGGLVAFPTETVYGLGADARSDSGVDKIFTTKGRPQDNPLIVHIHRDFDLNGLVYDEMPYAKKLREVFLPGPLTLVYRSKGKVSSKVSCGLDTLAVRVPSHVGAQAFLRYVDLPIAAPSANVSKHVSPVSAEHVFADLNGKIPLILDGGPSSGGIESTVCDVTGEYPVVLRQGLVSVEMIRSVVGKCGVYVPKEGEQVRSPGMKYKHYAPKCKTCLVTDAKQASLRFDEFKKEGLRAYVLCESKYAKYFPKDRLLDLGSTAEEMASRLYSLLREGELVADVIIAIEPTRSDGVMAGVLNRLNKACAEE